MSTTTAVQPLAGAYTADPVHSSFSFAAQVDSISIRSPQQFRDHVLSAEFFDVANHPQVAFRSTRVELADDGRALVDGELTIRGTTLPVHAEGGWTPEAELFGTRKGGLTLTATIDRTAYGLTWNADLPTGGKALANDVTLTVELTLLPLAPDAAEA
jgi:polyisoprenoid-binding protein YceI